MTDEARTWIAALRDSHDRLVSIVDGLATRAGDGTLRLRRVDDRAGALASRQRRRDLLSDGRGRARPARTPGPETFSPIWDAWNAKEPGRTSRRLQRSRRQLWSSRSESLDSQAARRVPPLDVRNGIGR